MKFILNWLFKNATVSQTIAKNTFWLFAGQMVGRLLRAAIVIYAARVLGAASWGAFSYALGISAFLTVFSDIGINALITKESARNPALKDKYLSTALFTKLGLLAVLIIAVFILFPIITTIEEAAALMPILIFVFAFDTLRDLGSAVSRALEKMQIEAGINIFTNFAIVVLGFIFLMTSRTSASLAMAYAIGSGLGLVAILYVLRDHFRNLLGNFDKRLIKSIFTVAWPFGLMGIMGAMMLNIDLIMLGWMRTAEEVGLYSAAQKPIQLLYILPTLLASSLFPVLSRLAKTAPDIAKNILKKYVRIVVALSLPIALGGIFLAGPVMRLLYGSEYLPAIGALQILSFTILIVYPSTLLGNAIFAWDHQKDFVIFVLVAFISKIAFNLILVPSMGIEGTALSMVFAQLLTNALIWRRATTL